MKDKPKFPGEFELISLLTRDEIDHSKGLVKGVGDDCAVIAKDDRDDFLITTDSLIEGVHFNRGWVDFETLGRKTLSVNLSDIAAMGGSPLFYLVDLGVPSNIGVDDLNALYSGMRQVSKRSEVSLIGGDTTSSKDLLYLSITVVGEVPKGEALMRSKAKPGDAIYVTGSLGGAALGLHCLMHGLDGDIHKLFIERHLDPRHRLSMGVQLRRSGCVLSMIDISDGLLADMGHIADESGTGFTIESTCVPLFTSLAEASSNLDRNPLDFALSGGEDYELLFTVNPEGEASLLRRMESLPLDTTITKIGVVEADRSKRVVLGGSGNVLNVNSSGFDHFRKATS